MHRRHADSICKGRDPTTQISFPADIVESFISNQQPGEVAVHFIQRDFAIQASGTGGKNQVVEGGASLRGQHAAQKCAFALLLFR